ncbi:MAG: hypothetical protein NTU76_02245 [Candidatus Taylorbacteria bacterium]|nr:hypothetical protein [Candidatus Taylorbacteria bacterium]
MKTSVRIHVTKAKDLFDACCKTQDGKDAFDDVVKLALIARRRICEITSQAVGSSAEKKATAEVCCQTILNEFYSIKGAILGTISLNVVEVDQAITLDDICNFKA